MVEKPLGGYKFFPRQGGPSTTHTCGSLGYNPLHLGQGGYPPNALEAGWAPIPRTWSRVVTNCSIFETMFDLRLALTIKSHES